MFYPASCDNNCKGCEMNSCGWCDWKDRATPYYKPTAFIVENKLEGLTVEESINIAERFTYADSLN